MILSRSAIFLFLNLLGIFCALAVSAAENHVDPKVVDAPDIEQEIVKTTQVVKVHVDDLLKKFSVLTQAQSPDFQTIKALKEQKKNQRYTALAKRFSPSVAAEISQERMINGYQDDDSTLSANSSGEDIPYTDGDSLTDWTIDLDLPLYRRSVNVQNALAGLDYDLAVINYDIAVKEMEIKLRELLGNYILASYNLLNLENSINISSDHVAQIQRGYDLRDQTRLALLRSQANLEMLKGRKEANEQRKDQALRELLDYTAMKQDDPLLIRLDQMVADEQQIVDLVDCFSLADEINGDIRPLIEMAADDALRDVFLEKSPLARKIRMEQESARARASQYTQEEFPELAVRGELMRKEDTPFEEMEGEGTVGLVLKVPVFSGGTLYSNAMTEEQARRVAAIQGESALRRQFNSLANKRKTIQSLENIYEIQQRHLAEQQEIVRLSLKSYQIKQTSMQELLDSNNALIDAKSSFMQTRITLNNLILQFAWETGSPLSF